MNRLLLIVLGALTGCTFGLPVGSTSTAALETQAKAWDEAIVSKDVNAITQNMADDFLQIDSRGGVSNKAEFLKAITAPDLKLKPYTVDGQTIRIFGNVALLTGTTNMSGTFKNRAFQTHYRYTDTYVFDGNRWRVVQVQTTEITP